MECITQNHAIDTIFRLYNQQLGSNFVPYRNHVYRVFNLTLAKHKPDSIRVLEVAAAFHDLGIYTHSTFDYLDPSIELALQYAQKLGFSNTELQELQAIIFYHHKLSRVRVSALAEAFRLADITDLSWGLLPNSHPKALIACLKTNLPSKGFHLSLTRLFFKNLWRNPFNPLPMYKW
jgi:hypothetical protein